ncbi:PEP-CTERM sorting domain-containing protein [Haloferula chungangensis]|uniref:PEP-CTERM sorting domain-containing protein n=1 Tax=Haloferula chungangensis TaxID=1048331 RepID=A0ABW2L9I8_9BACT
MKMLKCIILTAALTASASAATVGISPGFGAANGIVVTVDGVQTNYGLSVLGLVSDAQILFGSMQTLASGAKISGSFAANGPVSLNNEEIYLRVDAGGGWALLSTTQTFPADVSSAALSSTVIFSNSSATSIDSTGGIMGVEFTNANTLNFVTIPEPSVAILGALGMLGLVRRRR